MKRFLFKARSLNGTWLTGDIIHEGEKMLIKTGAPDPVVVEAATVSLCTGLKDKNGDLVFEGDILELPSKGRYCIEYAPENLSFLGKSDFAETFKNKLRISPMHLAGLIPGSIIVGNIHKDATQLVKYTQEIIDNMQGKNGNNRKR